MGKRNKGQRYRLPCSVCETKLDLFNPQVGRLVGLQVRGKLVTLVCNERCETQLYNNARFVNWLLHGDAVAEHSDVVLRHDLALKHGGVMLRDGKIVYVRDKDKVTSPNQ